MIGYWLHWAHQKEWSYRRLININFHHHQKQWSHRYDNIFLFENKTEEQFFSDDISILSSFNVNLDKRLTDVSIGE